MKRYRDNASKSRLPSLLSDDKACDLLLACKRLCSGHTKVDMRDPEHLIRTLSKRHVRPYASSPLVLLEANRIASLIPGACEDALRSIAHERATNLSDTIQCAAGLLSLHDGPMQQMSWTETKPFGSARSADSSAVQRASKSPSTWWTPEVLELATDLGMTAPPVFRVAWRVQAQNRKLALQAASLQGELIMIAGC